MKTVTTTPTTGRCLHALEPAGTSLSVIATLRRLMPQRVLRHGELERIAELQANRLIELAGLWEPPVPIDLITGLPRLQVVSVVDLPVGGMTGWVGGKWLVSIAAGDSPARQRYSIAHEFKHILDHPVRDLVFGGSAALTPADQAERIAEYFAACLLMPKRWVVRLWGQGVQRLSDLSQQFKVSPRAMQIRLWQLGLAERTPRCQQAVPVLIRPTGVLT